jgi:hypothetical protein
VTERWSGSGPLAANEKTLLFTFRYLVPVTATFTRSGGKDCSGTSTLVRWMMPAIEAYDTAESFQSFVQLTLTDSRDVVAGSRTRPVPVLSFSAAPGVPASASVQWGTFTASPAFEVQPH